MLACCHDCWMLFRVKTNVFDLFQTDLIGFPFVAPNSNFIHHEDQLIVNQKLDECRSQGECLSRNVRLFQHIFSRRVLSPSVDSLRTITRAAPLCQPHAKFHLLLSVFVYHLDPPPSLSTNSLTGHCKKRKNSYTSFDILWRGCQWVGGGCGG